MKKTKNNSNKVKVLLPLLILSVIISSCQEDSTGPLADINNSQNEESFPDQEAEFNKTLRVYDESGKYYIDMNLGANKSELIDYDLRNNTYSLKFEYEGLQNNETNSSNSDKTLELSDYDVDNEIVVSFVSMNLDPEASGFYLRVSPSDYNNSGSRIAVESYFYSKFYKSPGYWDYGKVIVDVVESPIILYPCPYISLVESIYVKWYYKNGTNGDFHFDYDVELVKYGCQNTVTYAKPDKRKLGASVFFNNSSSSYTVYWRETSTSDWLDTGS